MVSSHTSESGGCGEEMGPEHLLCEWDQSFVGNLSSLSQAVESVKCFVCMCALFLVIFLQVYVLVLLT